MQRSMPFTAAVRSPVGVAPRRRAASLKVVAAVKKGDKAPEFELKNQVSCLNYVSLPRRDHRVGVLRSPAID